jgi:hypothetical protein
MSRLFKVPGGKVTASIGIIACLFMLFLSLYQPYSLAEGTFPIEWGIILFWIVLGSAFWTLARKVRAEVSEEERRRLILSGLDITDRDREENSEQQVDP